MPKKGERGEKLTDKERKAIVAEYTNGEATHRSLAAKYGVAPNTIKNVLKENADFAQKCADIGLPFCERYDLP